MTDTEGPTRTDHEELKEIIKEFLHHLEFAYNYRLQKLVFYGEKWCLDHYGRRLSDAEFKPYDYGSFSDDIVQALEELREDGEVDYEIVVKQDGPTYEYHHHSEGGQISPGKKEIIKQIHEETRGLSTEELAEISKQDWLFRNTPKGEEMDFEYYRDEVMIPAAELEDVAARVDSGEAPDEVEDASELRDLI